MKKALSFSLIVLVLLACKNEVNMPSSFDYGSIENGVYENTFFKFKLPINPKWYVLDNEETDAVYKMGNDIVAGENESLKENLIAADINLAKLVTAFREQPGTSYSFNPSLVINAENLKSAPLVKTTAQYIDLAKNLLNQSNMQLKYIDEKDKVKIGSQDFAFIQLENSFDGIVVTQDYYCTLKNGFVLLFIMSYIEDTGKAEVYNMFDNLKI